ncbi:MAG: HPF/RaiA family ribosome-associated protein [Bacteroidota bacterium]
MKVNVQSIHFDADKKLVDFVQKKVEKLVSLYDGVIGSDVYLKLVNTSDLENKIAEIRLQIPGNDLFVKKQCKSFEEAADMAVEALKKQLTKQKDKKKK